MSLSGLYNRRVDIKRAIVTASTVSAAGAVTWAVVRHNVRCRLWPVTSRELERFAKTTAEMTHVMACGAGVNVRADDMLFEGSTKYEVAGPPQRMDGARRAHHLELPLLERMEA